MTFTDTGKQAPAKLEFLRLYDPRQQVNKEVLQPFVHNDFEGLLKN